MPILLIVLLAPITLLAPNPDPKPGDVPCREQILIAR